MIHDTIKVALKPRSHDSFVDMINDDNEYKLMVECCDYFFRTYEPRLTPQALERYLAKNANQKIILFTWFDYRIGRRWLATKQALSACLSLKRGFQRYETMP